MSTWFIQTLVVTARMTFRVYRIGECGDKVQGMVTLKFADLSSHEGRLARLARWQAATIRQHRVHPEICTVTSPFVVLGGLGQDGQDLLYYFSVSVGNLPKSITIKAACERYDISYGHDMAKGWI